MDKRLQNYYRQKMKVTIFSKRTMILILATIGILFMENIILGNSRMRGGQSNGWDLLLSILKNNNYYLFFFLPYLLLYSYEICHEQNVGRYVALRLGSRFNWLASKVLSILTVGTLFTVLYLVLVTMGAFLLQGYGSHWGIDYEFGYQTLISPVVAYVALSIRYLLSAWFITSVYLLVFLHTRKNQHVKAFMVCFIILFANRLVSVNFLMQWLPFLSISTDYVALIREHQGLPQFLLRYNTGVMASIISMYSVLWLTNKKIELGNE